MPPPILNLEERGKEVSFVILEMGTLGHLTEDALMNLSLLLNSHHKQGHQLWSVLNTLAKTAISCSKYIYQAHTILLWNSSTPLHNLHVSLVYIVSMFPFPFLFCHALPSPRHHCLQCYLSAILVSEVLCVAFRSNAFPLIFYE